MIFSKTKKPRQFAVSIDVLSPQQTEISQEIVCIVSEGSPTVDQVLKLLGTTDKGYYPAVRFIVEQGADYLPNYEANVKRRSKHFGNVYILGSPNAHTGKI